MYSAVAALDGSFCVSFFITFVNDDGKELQKLVVPYGEKPDYTGEEPAKKSNTWIPVVISITAVVFIATAAVVIVIRKKAS